MLVYRFRGIYFCSGLQTGRTMEKGRNIFFSFGRSPGARLPISIISLSLAIAAALCYAGCASRESCSPDIPIAPPRCAAGAAGGRDILDQQLALDLKVRIPDQEGRKMMLRTRAEVWWLIRRLDLFVFNEDATLSLDSYTRSYAYSPDVVSIPSASGDKRVVVVANRAFTDEFITTVHCYGDLQQAVTELTDDHPSWPVMSGETAFVAGQGHGCSVTLEPMLSAIEIKSLRCRMSDRSLSAVKVYLTGISNRAEILRQEGFLPAETLNNGGLSEKDLGRLPYSGMVYRYLGNGRRNGSETVYDGASLYCYPNEAEDDSPGSPFTRLVVEGVLDGQTCYYSFPINRSAVGGTDGIGRNCRYVFDLTLTRPGTESPDDIDLSSP